MSDAGAEEAAGQLRQRIERRVPPRQLAVERRHQTDGGLASYPVVITPMHGLNRATGSIRKWRSFRAYIS